MPVFAAIDEARMVADVRLLAAALLADAGWHADYIIGIGRGGLVPAVYLSHATGIAMLAVDYSSADERLAAATIDRLAERTRAGERLLFLDDINDSGRTIGHLRRMIADAGAQEDAVRFATLLDNVRSHERVDYRARTLDRSVQKDWFVFPWEAMAPAEALAEDAAEVPGRIA